jgi:hypothetical protein
MDFQGSGARQRFETVLRVRSSQIVSKYFAKNARRAGTGFTGAFMNFVLHRRMKAIKSKIRIMIESSDGETLDAFDRAGT